MAKQGHQRRSYAGPDTYCPACGRIVGTFPNGQFKPHGKRFGVTVPQCQNVYAWSHKRPPRATEGQYIDGDGI